MQIVIDSDKNLWKNFVLLDNYITARSASKFFAFYVRIFCVLCETLQEYMCLEILI